MYGEGISKTGDLLDLAVDKRIIEKSGAWFAYGGERLGQGRENVEAVPQGQPRGLQGHRGSRAPRARDDARSTRKPRPSDAESYRARRKNAKIAKTTRRGRVYVVRFKPRFDVLSGLCFQRGTTAADSGARIPIPNAWISSPFASTGSAGHVAAPIADSGITTRFMNRYTSKP